MAAENSRQKPGSKPGISFSCCKTPTAFRRWHHQKGEGTMLKSLRSISFIALAALAVACSDHQAPQPPPQGKVYASATPQPAPIIVQQAPQTGMQDLVTGAAIGALATHALAGGGRQAAQAAAPTIQHTTVVQKTVVVNNRPPAPPPRAGAPSSVVAAPAPAPAPVARPAPSYSPPSVASPSSYKVTYSVPPNSRR